jgi:hypothetical protein
MPALPFRHRALRIRASISADQLGASIASLKDMTATDTASRMSSAWRNSAGVFTRTPIKPS